MHNEYFTIDDLCAFLDVSRPTLDSYRTKHGIEHVLVKGRILFKKLDMLEKIRSLRGPIEPNMDLSVLPDFAVENLEVVPDVFDLGLIKTIDPFGAMCLLCCLKGRIANQRHVYLLTGMNSACLYLKGINFFRELGRVGSEYLHYDSDALRDVASDDSEVIIPLHLIGYKGGEKDVLESIYVSLKRQGFSGDICSSLGVTLGELADNATTHAQGPCYFMLSSTVGPLKFLTLTIGDVGLGIPTTIKSNDLYKDLDDPRAFISAFKSNVSSWEEHHKRGNGLNELLAIAKGNGAWVRAESNGMGAFFDFSDDSSRIIMKDAGTSQEGTRYCMVLIDLRFDHVTKKEIDVLLNNFLENL